MKRLLALLLPPLLGACAQSEIPVPASGPGRQDAICAITFSQWLGINSHDVQVLGRAMKGENALVRLGATEPLVGGVCEITPGYGLVAMTTEPARAAPAP
ncbi:hypothetical protein [Amaricoccus solimangrovi]|uniref:Lipoprotein n=1 Tax=Amaricoccus solimangrovi TaxID=2589815 RepID=A0A501WPC8_9RHOB|nr:hypothetical protein [Amaricoccus solimangrovi]TPE50185.1 hypothetical protein FJM51_12430 [Amaricoccus solimangrovi]